MEITKQELSNLLAAAVAEGISQAKGQNKSEKREAEKAKAGLTVLVKTQDLEAWKSDLRNFCPQGTHQLQVYTGKNGQNAGKEITSIQRGFNGFRLTLAVNGKCDLSDLAMAVKIKKQQAMEDVAYLEGMERYIASEYAKATSQEVQA